MKPIFTGTSSTTKIPHNFFTVGHLPSRLKSLSAIAQLGCHQDWLQLQMDKVELRRSSCTESLTTRVEEVWRVIQRTPQELIRHY